MCTERALWLHQACQVLHLPAEAPRGRTLRSFPWQSSPEQLYSGTWSASEKQTNRKTFKDQIPSLSKVELCHMSHTWGWVQVRKCVSSCMTCLFNFIEICVSTFLHLTVLIMCKLAKASNSILTKFLFFLYCDEEALIFPWFNFSAGSCPFSFRKASQKVKTIISTMQSISMNASPHYTSDLIKSCFKI